MRTGKRLVKAVYQKSAVGKSGQRVVVCHVRDLIFRLLALYDTGQCIGRHGEQLFFILHPFVVIGDIGVEHPENLVPKQDGDAIVPVRANAVILIFMFRIHMSGKNRLAGGGRPAAEASAEGKDSALYLHGFRQVALRYKRKRIAALFGKEDTALLQHGK